MDSLRFAKMAVLGLCAGVIACAPEGSSPVANAEGGEALLGNTEPPASPRATPATEANISSANVVQAADAMPGRWQFSADDTGAPAARFGPENSYVALQLSCNGSELRVSLGSIDPRPGLSPATLSAGDHSARAATTIEGEEISSLYFDVPLGNPVVADMARFGFVISFSNGERNAFPGDPVVARLVSACRGPQ